MLRVGVVVIGLLISVSGIAVLATPSIDISQSEWISTTAKVDSAVANGRGKRATNPTWLLHISYVGNGEPRRSAVVVTRTVAPPPTEVEIRYPALAPWRAIRADEPLPPPDRPLARYAGGAGLIALGAAIAFMSRSPALRQRDPRLQED